jgi:hypothetical protein
VIDVFCEARFAGLSPWFAPVRCRRRVRGIHFEFARRALCIIAPRSTPNELSLTAVTLFSQECAAVWSLAQAEGESQHSIPTAWARVLRLCISRLHLHTMRFV